MKIIETHKNGAKIELEGDSWPDIEQGLIAWRKMQDERKIDPADTEPQVKGTHSSFATAGRFDGDTIEHWSPRLKVPVIMGFVPNERNIQP